MSIIELTQINAPIDFSDPEVKRRCVTAGWDLDGDGEISYAEAALVKDIGCIFSEVCEENNYKGTRIQSFNEFQYFIGIESIPDFAFASCLNLHSIELPCTVKSIGNYAFERTGIKCLSLPDGLIKIGERAFENSELETINIPESIQTIRNNPFLNCINLKCFEGKYASMDGRCLIDGVTIIAFAPYELKEYTLPNMVEHLGYGVFSNSHLSALRLPVSLRSIGEYALDNFEGTLYINSNIEEGSFSLNQLSTVIFGPNVTTVSKYLLSWSYYLENVIFESPDRIISIQDGAFSHCASLRQIKLPPNLERLGKGVFENSGLTSLQIPDGIVSLPDRLCAGCKNLTNIILGEKTKEIGALCFADCYSLNKIVIPLGVTTIGDGAFADCLKLQEVSLPDTLEVINDDAFIRCENIINLCLPESLKKIGKLAFFGCTRVRSISFPLSSSLLIDENAFSKCGVPAVTTNIDDTELLIHYIEKHVFGHIGTYPFVESPIAERYRKRVAALKKEQAKQKTQRNYYDIINEEELRREMIEDGIAEAFNSDDSSRWNID